MSADTADVDWDLSKSDSDLLEKFHAEFDDKTDEGFEKHNAKAMGFFDWIMDLFDWWDDAKEDVEEVIDDRFSDEGISGDPYNSEKYGMNLHDVDTMTVEEYKRSLAYAGTWVRITISTDEVADRNWGYRLEPALTNIKTAADELGVVPNIVINLSGYSNHTTGSKYLLEGLSWEEKAERYKDIAFALTSHVHQMGFTDTIFESWNEPDNHEAGMGIGLDPDDPNFKYAISTLNNGFANGVKQSNGRTAFSPFMTINDERFDLVKSVWMLNYQGFDYFSTHYYDDEPGKARYYADQTSDYLAQHPVIITEHGYQHYRQDVERYRKQAWAFEEGFSYNGESTLQGVMGYVYGSTHEPWVIDDDDDFFWKVTHNNEPSLR